MGAANLPEDGGYVAKVLGEQAHLRLVASGRAVALNVPQAPVVVRAEEPAPADADAAGADKADPAPQASAAGLQRVALTR